MINIALFEPEIPPNTGNIIRLCANTGAHLHLIKPLGFSLNEKSVKRAGLDYHDLAAVTLHENFFDFVDALSPHRIFALSTKGTTYYHQVNYQAQDVLLFGPETRGLSHEIRQHSAISDVIKIPMVKNSRSLNLSNSVAIITYEVWRQFDFVS